jgi:hypothetical protein
MVPILIRDMNARANCEDDWDDVTDHKGFYVSGCP